MRVGVSTRKPRAVGRLEKLAMIERRPIAVGASIDATIRAPSSGIEPASTAPLK